MADLATRPKLLAVQVDLHIGPGGEAVMDPLVDARRSTSAGPASTFAMTTTGAVIVVDPEGVVQHRAQMLLELRGARALDSPVGQSCADAWPAR